MATYDYVRPAWVEFSPQNMLQCYTLLGLTEDEGKVLVSPVASPVTTSSTNPASYLPPSPSGLPQIRTRLSIKERSWLTLSCSKLPQSARREPTVSTPSSKPIPKSLPTNLENLSNGFGIDGWSKRANRLCGKSSKNGERQPMSRRMQVPQQPPNKQMHPLQQKRPAHPHPHPQLPQRPRLTSPYPSTRRITTGCILTILKSRRNPSRRIWLSISVPFQ
jgi:hypothetical protein